MKSPRAKKFTILIATNPGLMWGLRTSTFLGCIVAKLPLYLVYGNNLVQVDESRIELVNSLISREERDSGYTEFRGPGNQQLTLAKVFDDLISEMGTSSFLPGAKRVSVVYDLKEFFQAKAAPSRKKPSNKKTANATAPPRDIVQEFTDWMDGLKGRTENVIIFVCFEDEEKNKRLNEKSPLFQYLAKEGKITRCKEKALNFELEEHLLNRDGFAALETFRLWIRRVSGDSGARLRIYRTIANMVELTLQGRCASLAREKGISPKNVLPPETKAWGAVNIATLPPWKAKKIYQLAEQFSLEDLLELSSMTHKIQTLLYPKGDEDYIPDWHLQAEILILMFCDRTRQPVAFSR